MSSHSGFSIRQCGFVVDQDTPFLGSSPDGFVECDCCGRGVVEVKCLLRAEEAGSLEMVAKKHKNFCLEMTSGSLKLSTDHPYYLQCQLQMFTRRAYCHFVVWHQAGLYLERLVIDNSKLLDALNKADVFFTHTVLPELTAKYFSRRSRETLSEIQPEEVHDEDDGKWCFCKDARGGEMIACDGKHCKIKWFHISCLN